jgi:NAD(P)-dependent dehydrogenase (short-subunit alcohol dehydrogenase family)
VIATALKCAAIATRAAAKRAAHRQEISMSSDHTVIVGGSSGIGLATARHLLASGGRVTITGRNSGRLEEARRLLGNGARAAAMDAADAASLPEAFAAIGPMDHLVLALGSRKGFGPFATMNVAEMRQSFEEKVYAHFAAAQAALPFLRQDGSVTFVSAVSAHAGAPGTSGIGAANAAVAALVPILAAELRPLRVNGVSPGVIDTPWWDFMPRDEKQAVFDEYGAKSLVGRVGTADDVASAISFLVGNTFVTGHVLLCDGGLRWVS